MWNGYEKSTTFAMSIVSLKNRPNSTLLSRRQLSNFTNFNRLFTHSDDGIYGAT
jgi:hypothetical protein